MRNTDLSRLVPSKKMIVIGAGSIPSTILKAWDLKIFESFHAFDVDSEAKGLGSKLLDHLGIPGCYDVCDGTDVDYREAGIVFIANLVQGKREVLNRCYLTSSSEVQVVIRLSSSSEGDVDAFSTDDIDCSQWQILHKGQTSSEFSSFNVFLKKVS